MKIEISNDKSTATIDGVEYELKAKGKKISEWLQELPDGYRELALANFKKSNRDDFNVKSIGSAIYMINWKIDQDIYSFWNELYNYYNSDIQELLPPLPKPKFEVWKPKVGEMCYWVGSDEISLLEYFDRDYPFLNFRTYEKAEEFVEKMQFNYEVEMFIKEKNEGWVADYNDLNQVKHRLFLDGDTGKLSIAKSFGSKHVSNEKVPKTEKIGREIIEKFDNEKLIKYWI